MPEDDPLKSLLDGDISSEELEAIRSSPDLRKLAIRMYGESILNLLGEEEIEVVESVEKSQDDALEMVDIIPEPIQVVRSTIETPGRSKGQVENKSSIGSILRIGVGLSFGGVGLTNVYWGFGNILSTCASEIHSTCGVSLKLNLLEFHRMQEHIAWGPTGQWGIPDIALVGIGVVSLILGIVRRR
ncbi:MAG: hypothetical protein VXW30_06085 [Candidatus Thermoplasmatota archaeon]|nr:hypothetical protein [Candidatus Thermoplasmatota archaeon]